MSDHNNLHIQKIKKSFACMHVYKMVLQSYVCYMCIYNKNNDNINNIHFRSYE